MLTVDTHVKIAPNFLYDCHRINLSWWCLTQHYLLNMSAVISISKSARSFICASFIAVIFSFVYNDLENVYTEQSTCTLTGSNGSSKCLERVLSNNPIRANVSKSLANNINFNSERWVQRMFLSQRRWQVKICDHKRSFKLILYSMVLFGRISIIFWRGRSISSGILAMGKGKRNQNLL